MTQREDGRRLGKAWRNAGLAAVAVGVLIVGTQGVLAVVGSGDVADQSRDALAACGEGNVASVSADAYRCAD